MKNAKTTIIRTLALVLGISSFGRLSAAQAEGGAQAGKAGPAAAAAITPGHGQTGRVKLEVFFESMDGAGWQWFFLGDAVRRRLPSAVELQVYPLLSKNDKGEWESKRGQAEIDESMRIAVVSKFYGDKLSSYLNARSLSPWADGWRDAAIFSGIPVQEFETRTAKNGRELMNKVYDRVKKADVTGTVVLLNGKPYAGGAKLLAFFSAVNELLPQAKRVALPKTAEVPAAAKVPAPKFWIVLSSGVEKNNGLVDAFSRYFSGIKPAVLDYDSPERLKNFPDLDFLPAYVIEDNKDVRTVLEAEIKAGIFTERKGYLVYFDKQRKGLYAAAKPEPGVLKLFVMSQCPYGVTAENGLLDAVNKKLLPAGTKVQIHYIGDSEKGADGQYTFKSLHGTPEWEEDVRQLVIAQKFPAKFNAYLLERNRDVSSTQWEEAAKKAGLDPKAVTAGFEDGKALLAEDFKYTAALGMTTSPSFLWEGRLFVVGMGELAKVPGFENVKAQGSTGAGCAK
ncbi:MAG: hypothetical protein WCW52_00560 [Elusimicrobiales bacterium]|jgi:hypothetical protein